MLGERFSLSGKRGVRRRRDGFSRLCILRSNGQGNSCSRPGFRYLRALVGCTGGAGREQEYHRHYRQQDSFCRLDHHSFLLRLFIPQIGLEAPAPDSEWLPLLIVF